MHKQERLTALLDASLYKETGIHNAYHKYIGAITIEDIFTLDAVYIAARRCSCGFMHKRDTQSFMSSPWVNALSLKRKVLSGKFKPRYYSERVIMERGKPRVIKPPAFECKVVQKVLCDYIVRSILEARMIRTNYASIKGRGTELMFCDIYKALKKNENDKNKVIVMTDFSGYFASINNDILFGMFARYIRDSRIIDLMRLFSPDKYGLSLGNELSQVPASFFPSPIDHYIKDRLGIKDFYRFMDDTLAILPDKDHAISYIQTFKEQAALLDLRVKDEKIRIVPMGKSFVFCKERFLWGDNGYYRMINPSAPRNEKRKLGKFNEKLKKGEMTMEEITMQYKCVRGAIASRPNTKCKLKELDEIYKSIGENKDETKGANLSTLDIETT